MSPFLLQGRGRLPVGKMDISDNQYCFICGKDNPVGLQLEINVDQAGQSATIMLAVPAEYQGWQGMVHGGIISALLDEVCAYAGMTVAERVVTGELKTRFRKPVPVETDIKAVARVISHARRTVLVEAELFMLDDVLATAEAKMVIVNV